MKYVDMKVVIKKHKGHWFSDGAMAFFDTTLDSEAYMSDDGWIFFVTGEQYENTGRLWSLRCCLPDGAIATIGNFQKYGSKAEARAAAMEYAKCLTSPG